jgi:hypothetical protein
MAVYFKNGIIPLFSDMPCCNDYYFSEKMLVKPSPSQEKTFAQKYQQAAKIIPYLNVEVTIEE